MDSGYIRDVHKIINIFSYEKEFSLSWKTGVVRSCNPADHTK